MLLVTGISGFVGSWLARSLVEMGREVVGIVRDLHPQNGLELLGIKDKVHLVFSNIREQRLIQRTIAEYGVTEIYHAAAQAIVSHAQRSPATTFETNVIGTVNVLESARICQVDKILVISTDKVYGDNTLPFTEALPLLARGPYEASKACADIIARGYAKTYDMKIVVSRACNIIGEGDRHRRLVPNTIRHCLKGENPIIYTGTAPFREYIREYIYVKDAVSAYIKLMENIDKTKGEAFNVGSGFMLRQSEVIQSILKQGFPRYEPQFSSPRKLSEISDSFLSSEKIRQTIGWQAKVSFEEAISQTIDWWRNHQELA